MLVAELVQPGSWIDHPDRDKAFELETLFNLAEANLAEANLALLLFEQEMAAVDDDDVPSLDDWQRENDAYRVIEERLEAELPPMSFEEQWKARERIRFEARRQVARDRWARGELPRSLRHRRSFLYARNFLFALDNIAKVLDVIAKHPIPTTAAVVCNALDRAVPDLKGVRNTAHHHEDRIRGLDHKQRPIQPQPIASGGIRSAGGALVLDNLCDNRYGCTLADGRFAEIELSETSLFAARDAIQLVLDSITWKGPPRLLPDS